MLKKLTAAGFVAATAAGVMLLGSPAQAGVWHGHGGGVLSGNDINIPINAPINVCGNAIAIIGGALAGCAGGASVGGHHHHGGY